MWFQIEWNGNCVKSDYVLRIDWQRLKIDDEKNVYPEEKILDLKIKERLIGNFIAIPGQTSMFCANLHTSTLYIQNQCQAVIKNVAAEKNIEEVEIPTDPDIWFFTRARDGINFQNFDSQLIFLGAPSSLHE